jgi:hypothetical protein
MPYGYTIEFRQVRIQDNLVATQNDDSGLDWFGEGDTGMRHFSILVGGRFGDLENTADGLAVILSL